MDRPANKPAEASITREAVSGRVGSMTAHQAWALVAPVAKALDPNPKLTLITSGLDMNRKG